MEREIPTKEVWMQVLRERHGARLQEKWSHSAVAVCGLGGLGSNIAIALARAGVGKLILIDFDRVDISNLHRQQYKANQVGMYKTEALRENLREITPYTEIEIHTLRMTEENIPDVLKGADVVCEAFDVPEAKAELVNGVLEKLPSCPVVAASGMAGLGEANAIGTRRVTSRFYLCGDETTDTAAGLGLIASRVMVCAAHQAHKVLQLLAEEQDTK